MLHKPHSNIQRHFRISSPTFFPIESALYIALILSLTAPSRRRRLETTTTMKTTTFAGRMATIPPPSRFLLAPWTHCRRHWIQFSLSLSLSVLRQWAVIVANSRQYIPGCLTFCSICRQQMGNICTPLSLPVLPSPTVVQFTDHLPSLLPVLRRQSDSYISPSSREDLRHLQCSSWPLLRFHIKMDKVILVPSGYWWIAVLSSHRTFTLNYTIEILKDK